MEGDINYKLSMAFDDKDFGTSFFPTLSKIWGELKSSDEDFVEAGKEIVRFDYDLLKYKYPKLNDLKGYDGRTLNVVGVFTASGKMDGPPLEEQAKEKLGIEVSADKHMLIHIPTDIIGGAKYVVFEIPSPEDEVLPLPVKLDLSKVQSHKVDD